MRLPEIQEMWKKDCVINELDLGHSAAEVPKLHAKYIELLVNAKLQFRRTESEYLRLRRNKRSWYLGEMSEEELKTLQWEPYLKKRPLKNELDEIIQTDEDVIKLQDRYEYLKATIYCLESIIKSIQSRGWDIKSSLEYMKFTSGMM